VSPKLTLAYAVSPSFELYADAGRGFHSNDARGATETISPGTGLPTDPVQLIAPALGAETGFRWNYGSLTTTATLFWLHLDSELTFAGDAGDTESSSATQRVGGELLLNWHPIHRIDIDFSAATAHARYLGTPVDGTRIPNAIEYMMTGGISALITDSLSATLTARYLGPSPLTQDGLVRSEAALDTNFLVRYHWGRFTFTGQILNLLNNADNDIQYFYTSRLPGETAEGVDDFHIHPMEPRTWRVGARMTL
jgi:outer membrane receptor protein involved in Fe transport